MEDYIRTIGKSRCSAENGGPVCKFDNKADFICPRCALDNNNLGLNFSINDNADGPGRKSRSKTLPKTCNNSSILFETKNVRIPTVTVRVRHSNDNSHISDVSWARRRVIVECNFHYIYISMKVTVGCLGNISIAIVSPICVPRILYKPVGRVIPY